MNGIACIDMFRLIKRRAILRRVRSGRVRGVTLIEVLIVVAILSMIGAGVTVAAFPRYQDAQRKSAETAATSLRQIVGMWQASHATAECPSISQLAQDKVVDGASRTDDPWGRPYKITCEDSEVKVTSSGPDRKDNTDDDISVPAKPARS